MLGEARPQRVSLLERVLNGAVRLDHHVGDRQPIGVAGLGVDAVQRLIAGHSPVLDHPFDSSLGARVDHHDHVELINSAGIHEERHVVDDDRVRVCCCGSREELVRASPDCRVGDCVQGGACFWRREDDGSQGRAIECAVCVDDTGAESIDNLGERWRPWLHHLPGQLVGVHDDGAVLGQPRRDDRLSGGDPPREADELHSFTLCAVHQSPKVRVRALFRR